MAKTSTGLVDYCTAQIGKPYWYGTFGQTATQYVLDYNKSRFPQYYAAADFKQQLGQRVHDCSGLIKGYMWSESPDSAPKYCSNGFPDMDANTMKLYCQSKPISTLEDVPGVLVFASDHVGVYVGAGEVVEARGHSYGIVKTKLKDRFWTHWGYLPGIEYGAVHADGGKYAKLVRAAAENGIVKDQPLTLEDFIKIIELMEELYR